MRDIDHFQDFMLNFMLGAIGDYLMIGQHRVATTRIQNNEMNYPTIDYYHYNNNNNNTKTKQQQQQQPQQSWIQTLWSNKVLNTNSPTSNKLSTMKR